LHSDNMLIELIEVVKQCSNFIQCVFANQLTVHKVIVKFGKALSSRIVRAIATF